MSKTETGTTTDLSWIPECPDCLVSENVAYLGVKALGAFDDDSGKDVGEKEHVHVFGCKECECSFYLSFDEFNEL